MGITVRDDERKPHLLQLQLALSLPHDVTPFQQLLLGLLKFLLPLEQREDLDCEVSSGTETIAGPTGARAGKPPGGSAGAPVPGF